MYKRIIGRSFILFVPPALLFWYLFNPFSEYALEIPGIPKGQTEVAIPISQSDLNRHLSRHFLSQTLEVPLKLKWYKVCFSNNLVVYLDEKKIFMPKAGDIDMQIYRADNNSLLEEKKIENKTSGCMVFDGDIDSKIRFVYYWSLPGNTPNGIYDFQADTSTSKLTITNSVSALFAKMFALLLVWFGLIMIFRSMKEYLLGVGAFRK